MKLIIPGIPQPKQSARFRIAKSGNKNFIMSYQKKEVKQNEQNIRSIIISQLPSYFKPYQNGVRIKSLLYVFPPLKTHSKKIKGEIAAGAVVYKTTKPDLTDNLQKGLFDSVEGILFLNDSQVCEIQNVSKIYGEVPRIEIEIEEVI